MPAADQRAEYVLRLAQDYLGTQAGQLAESSELAAFLNDGNITLLRVGLINGKLAVSNEPSTAAGQGPSLVLSKNRPVVLDAENIRSVVSVSSMVDPTASLYNLIHNVYAPLLAKCAAEYSSTVYLGDDAKLDQQLKNLLTDLEAGLAAVMRRTGQSADTQLGGDESSSILTPVDEYHYWADRAGYDASSQQFRKLLEPLKKFEEINTLGEEDVLDLLKNTEQALEDIWKSEFQYPEKRMRHLLGVIGGAVGRYMQHQFASLQVWKDPFREVEKAASYSQRICREWLVVVDNLNTKVWPPGAREKPWQGKLYSDAAALRLLERVEEVIKLRTVHEELCRLLSLEEQRELRVEGSFGPLQGMSPMHLNEYTLPAWKAALEERERIMEPIEHRIADKLRSHFAGSLLPMLQESVSASATRGGAGKREAAAQPHQLLLEFSRYSSLLARTSIARVLAPERNKLLDLLRTYVDNCKRELQERAAARYSRGQGKGDGDRAKNMSEATENACFAAQLMEKVQQTAACASNILAELPRLPELQQQCSDLAAELNAFKKESFKAWGEELEEAMSDPNTPLALQMSGKLMDWDLRDGKLKVNYSERLVQLLREVRQMQALGFPVSSKYVKIAADGNKFYQQAVVLKQVANFYNTIDQQMIECQKGMLIDLAIAFERVVKDPKTRMEGQQVTWQSSAALDSYINTLQSSADKLSGENRRLRKLHAVLGEKVTSLMSCDIVRQFDKWKAALKDIRDIFADLERQGYKKEGMIAWQVHWDYQLYKALEHQYQMGLETLNENLPVIDIDLVFAGGRLQFSPPYEEVRNNYFKELKTFLSRPLTFQGINIATRSDFFKEMIDRNAAGLQTVYMKADALFNRLLQVQHSMQDWVVLGAIEADEFVEQNVVEVSEFDANFKMIKQKLKELEKLPNQFEVDCIRVNVLPLKRDIESIFKRVTDSLTNHLRKTVQKNLTELEAFVDGAMSAMNTRPQSVEEISAARAKFDAFMKERPAMVETKRKMEDRNKMLKSSTGAGIDVMPLHQRWEKLNDFIEAFDSMMQDQRDRLRGEVDKRIGDHAKVVGGFASRWTEVKKENVNMQSREACKNRLARLREMKTEFDELAKTAKTLATDAQSFDAQPPNFAQIGELENDFAKTLASWEEYDKWSKDLDALACQKWVEFRTRTYELEDLITKWTENLKQKQSDPVLLTIRAQIDSYRKAYPLLRFVRGDAFTGDHWGTLGKIIGIAKLRLDDLTLEMLLGVADAIVAKANDLKELHSRAEGETRIRKAMDELRAWGADTTFELFTHTEHGRTTTLIKEWQDVQTKVGDKQQLLLSLQSETYYHLFKEESKGWEEKLGALDSILSNLAQVQRKWLYLEPFFMRGVLPDPARFKQVDSEFRAAMQFVKDDDRVMSLVTGMAGLQQQLPEMVRQLDLVKKALNDFLEEKRSAFPRFYFIGDEDLLQILGRAHDPEVIQSHLKKLFAGIHTVVFSEGAKEIVAMRSLEGEVVKLDKPVLITERVEEFLGQLAERMQHTLKRLLESALREEDIVKYPSQVLCLAEMIHFTARCEEAITSGTISALIDSLRQKLAYYTSPKTREALKDDSNNVLDLKVKALVMDLIHNIDVAEQVKRAACSTTSDWVWQKQLRYYSTGGEVRARMVDADILYTFEYQGNAPKLVHTPLTDKCYLTLTQGIRHGYGGNPYGPAGTGKTESVKALAQALGRQCLVFNCDEGIDFKSMGRIFTGLVKCGAWGCFDEFNRLEEDVLSAVSQQIQIIQTALKNRAPTLNLLEKDISVNPNAGIFVTLNPAGKGYLGRSKLPDNLKQLFRAVAMSAPDNDLIAEVILYSEGFTHAKDLARKIVSVFQVAKQLLSQQQHYDWGLRSLKTVLQLAGQLIQAEKKKGERAVNAEVEAELVIKSLRVNTLSKLTFADSHRFNALIADIFPGAQVADIAYTDLEKAMKDYLGEQKLQVYEGQVKKMLQFYEATKQRMGVVIVGPSGCGKSTLWDAVCEAMRRLGQRLVVHQFNPKAMDRTQLLGRMDNDTREWFDGVLTRAARQVIAEPEGTHTWIVADGDIDPEWIESLNSVLDDNRLLTMPSGERIQFGPNVNFIFETHSLKFASPATVSRMGMIFLSEENLETQMLVKSWIAKQPAELQSDLQTWMDTAFYKALDHVRQSKAIVVDTTRVGIVDNVLAHLRGVKTKPAFAVALIRGFGANMEPEARVNLARYVYELTGERMLDQRRPLDATFDGELGVTRLYQFEAANLSAEDIKATGALPLVPTIDMQRTRDMLRTWIDAAEPVLLVGPEGCGKNLLLNSVFADFRSCQVATIHCSAQTNAYHVIQKLNQVAGVFSSSSGRVYRPRDAERLIVYLKDINLPKPDKYETMQLVAFLHQLITYKGFFDKNLEWLGLERIQIVASMNPATTVGRHPLSTRFTAAVRIAYMSYPDAEQLQTVYSAALRAVVGPALTAHPIFKSDDAIRKLAASMADVYEQTRQSFSVDERRHYLYTPRELTAWTLGLQRYDLASQDLLDVWRYEAERIFRDRLVDEDSCKRWNGLIAGVLRRDWRVPGDGAGDAFYSTLATPGQPGLLRIARKDLTEVVQQGLTMYERSQKELGIILFPEVLDHLARFDRVLSSPGGSLLLAGRNGVGRRTGAILVAHMLRMQFFSPCVTKEYGVKAFQQDLKNAMLQTGVKGEPMLFYIEDHQLHEPTFLELLNSLLSGGEVPGLFTPEELEPHLQSLRELMREQGFRHKTLFNFFASRVQRNLHVVISMDPTNPSFVVNCESNPALYTRCSIQWLDNWSGEGFKQITRLYLADLFSVMAPNDAERERLVQQMISIHQWARGASGATPRQYIAFMETYRDLVRAKREAHEEQKKHLASGLSKLTEAAKKVEELSREAEVNRKKLSEKQKAADEALQKITVAMKTASERKTEVETLSQKLAVEEQKLKQRRGQVDAELAECQPLLDAAKDAVGQIRNDNLTEIRSLKAPPEPIRDVLEGVLRLMGIYDTSWTSMKRFLGNRQVKEEILNFDARNVTPQIRRDVKSLIAERPASFERASIYRVSVAAGPLAEWTVANIRYSEVLEKIGPLEQELQSLVASQQAARDRVQKCEQALSVLDKQIGELKDDFSRKTGEAETLKIKVEKETKTLEAAQALFGKLGGEKTRWEQQSRDLDEQLKQIPRNALLASGFVTYLAATPEDVREKAIKEWCRRVELESFTFKGFMSSESQMLVWKKEGLPADELSMENAICIEASKQVPFIVDPSTQAIEWLRKYLERQERPVEVLVSGEAKFATTVEMAVRFGKTLLITEVDRVEPMLYPILRRDLARDGLRSSVQIGDKLVDYNEKFRIFLATRNPHPDLPPDAISLVNEINFLVTKPGLEGQLLSLTLQYEDAKLEEEKHRLLQEEEDAKVETTKLEKLLLDELASSQGNILENEALITSLETTKQKAIVIQHALVESQKLQAEIDKKRNVYRKIASVGATVYFLMKDIARVNTMYRFALATFLRLFRKALQLLKDEGSAEKDTGRRIAFLQKHLIVNVVNYVCRSLFKADRLTFALHICHGLFVDKFAPQEWELFTGQIVVADVGEAGARSFPAWATRDRAGAYALLESTFGNLVRGCGFNEADWQRWAKSPACESEFPAKAAKSLTPFQQLLVVQALRPDRLQSAMRKFVCEALGVESLGTGVVNLGQVFEEETAGDEPILLITTPGADPSQELEEIAGRVVGPDRYRQLAMGQGQAETALALVREAAENGYWLCLKNLHLVTGWIGTLEKTLKTVQPHAQFRLWLTSEPHTKFPAILLERSLKITFEAPPGVKRNLQRSFEALVPTGEHSTMKPFSSALRAQLTFVLAWFHALVQERRTYIPQGWSTFYEFSFADLRSAADILDQAATQAKDAGRLPWPAIHGLLLHALYGGRVDNPYDTRVLTAYLTKYFSPETLKGAQKLYANLAVPASPNPMDYHSIISALSEAESPALFGLPANTERVVQRTASAAVLASLKGLSLSAALNAKFDRDLWARQLNPILALWQKLTGATTLLKDAPPAASPGLSPVDTFAYMEAAFGHESVAAVDASLAAIARVIKGAALLTPAIHRDAAALLAGALPARWSERWDDGPSAPQAWLRELVHRATACAQWRESAKQGSLLKQRLNLADLFHPDTFLNALRQQTARALKRPMDALGLAAAWGDGAALRAAIPVQVAGLLIQGANVDGGRLSEVAADAPAVFAAPGCTLGWLPREEAEASAARAVAVPVYFATDRARLLTELPLEAPGDRTAWTLAGVALALADFD